MYPKTCKRKNVVERLRMNNESAHLTRTRGSIAQYVERSWELRRPNWLYKEISASNPVGLCRSLTIGTLADVMGITLPKNRFCIKILPNFFTMAAKSKPYLQEFLDKPDELNAIDSNVVTSPLKFDSKVMQRSKSLSTNPNPLHDDPNIVKIALGYAGSMTYRISSRMRCLIEVFVIIKSFIFYPFGLFQNLLAVSSSLCAKLRKMFQQTLSKRAK